MYRINQQTNSIQKIEETTFKEIGASERNHLQEWIAKNPEVLCGEDERLLIIQKEFDGFNDTRERLDLLALDNHGNLVVIENKLDDSGRDVTWQALKYASYCSTLQNSDIVSMYQDYLVDEGNEDTNAAEALCIFLNVDSLDDVVLNESDQRIILIAHNFRKEVTSTALWLLDRGIQLQCFKAVPFVFGEEQLLNIEQIIPLPETQEFTISSIKKEQEVKKKAKQEGEIQLLNLEFWTHLKNFFTQNGFDYFESISPQKRHYLSFRVDKAQYVCVQTKKFMRVELYMHSDSNNAKFNALRNFEHEIAAQFGEGIEWQPLPDKGATRVKYEVDAQQLNLQPLRDKQDWDKRIQWLFENMVKFHEAVHPYWLKANNHL